MKQSKFRIGDEVEAKTWNGHSLGTVLAKECIILYDKEDSVRSENWGYYIEIKNGNYKSWFSEEYLKQVTKK